ncbi:MAG: hypothetical protein ACP5JG_17160 [Anaerolineae bacterium]
MSTLILAFLALIVLFTLAAYLVGRWFSRYVEDMIRSRVRAIHQIVNKEQVPESWIRRYRLRIAKLRSSSADESRIARVKRRAQKRALTNVEQLVRYVEKTGITDTPETKRLVVAELKEQAKRWRDDEVWDALMQKEPIDEEEGEVET